MSSSHSQPVLAKAIGNTVNTGIVFVDGRPGGGPCVSCGAMDETRMGVCWDCACAGEEKAARRSVLQHIGHGLARVARGRFDFGTRMDFMWAWERLTKTGDYAHGGEFDSAVFQPQAERERAAHLTVADTSRTSNVGPGRNKVTK